MIAIDAYRPPYIPFHLTTVEFFQLVREHLSEDGVVAINVGRTDTNFALVDALTATLSTVFPTVYVIDEPGPPATLANSLVVATMQPMTLGDAVGQHRRPAGLDGARIPRVCGAVRNAGQGRFAGSRTRPSSPTTRPRSNASCTVSLPIIWSGTKLKFLRDHDFCRSDLQSDKIH